MTINHRIYPDNGQQTCLLPGPETGNFYESLGESRQPVSPAQHSHLVLIQPLSGARWRHKTGMQRGGGGGWVGSYKTM